MSDPLDSEPYGLGYNPYLDPLNPLSPLHPNNDPSSIANPLNLFNPLNPNGFQAQDEDRRRSHEFSYDNLHAMPHVPNPQDVLPYYGHGERPEVHGSEQAESVGVSPEFGSFYELMTKGLVPAVPGTYVVPIPEFQTPDSVSAVPPSTVKTPAQTVARGAVSREGQEPPVKGR